jgi:hypothetical protein
MNGGLLAEQESSLRVQSPHTPRPTLEPLQFVQTRPMNRYSDLRHQADYCCHRYLDASGVCYERSFITSTLSSTRFNIIL